MSKQIVNIIATTERFKGLIVVKISKNDEVYADQPFAVIEAGMTYQKPVIYGDYKGIPSIQESSIAEMILARLKDFHLKIKPDGHFDEVPEAEATHHFKLPPDTPVEELMLDGKRLVRFPIPKSLKKESDVEEEVSPHGNC